MKHVRSWVITVLLLFFSFQVSADDDPSDVEGTQKLDQQSCVDEATQNCIDDACLTSDDVDCQDNCGKLAQQKCQEQLNE